MRTIDVATCSFERDIKYTIKERLPEWAEWLIGDSFYKVGKKIRDWFDRYLPEISYYYRTVHIDLDRIDKEIYEQIDFHYNYYQEAPKYLVIGRDYYERLRIELEPQHSMCIFIDGYIYGGIQVLFIPWIKGMFCLPDLGKIRVGR